MTFPCARKLGNICCGHQMFLNKIRNIFVSWTQNLCPQQMLRARANGETFVSATMCPQQCVLVCQYLKGGPEKPPGPTFIHVGRAPTRACQHPWGPTKSSARAVSWYDKMGEKILRRLVNSTVWGANNRETISNQMFSFLEVFFSHQM